MIGFEHSQWLWAGFAALIPIIIHLMGRRPAQPIAIPSLMWLNSFQAKQRKRHKLRDRVVLLLRVLTLLAIVVALAKPKFSDSSTTIIVDNHPAGWNQRTQWLPNVLSLLPEGTVNLHLRGGAEFNNIEKDAVLDVLAQWPSSHAPLPTLTGTLVSYGFTALDSTYEHYLLPKRSIIPNAQLTHSIVKDEVMFSTPASIGRWRMFEGEQLILEWDSIAQIGVQLALFKKDQEYKVVHSADSLEEDNSISLVRKSGMKRLLFYRSKEQQGQAARVARTFSMDTVVQYKAAQDFSALTSATVLLYGFDFVPSSVMNEAQTVLVFPELQEQAERITQSRPNLNHPFYARYFIGASTRNNWPLPKSSKILDEGFEPLVISDQGVLSGFKTTDSRRMYWQGFDLGDLQHPYYTALKQWSYQNNSLEIQQPPFLGVDAYAENCERISSKLDLGIPANKTLENQALSGLPGDYSKIALLFALLFALLAVIFVKIF